MKDAHSEISQRREARKSTQIMSLPGKEALERILDSPTPAYLIQSLAPEDLYWLIQDIGPEDALPILARSTNEQWEYVLDLELWARDRVDLDALRYWLALLMKADPQRLVAWGISRHATLISFHLYNSIEVRVREENDPSFELDGDYFSFDGTYYMRVRNDLAFEPVHEFLKRLAEYDLNRFHQALTELSDFLPWESEEEIYRLRNVRLAERGFLPYEEAIGIYQHLDVEKLTPESPVAVDWSKDPETEDRLPVSTWLSVDAQDRFHRSIMAIEDPAEVERLQDNFAVMCNRIISADGMQARNKEDLVAVVRKACGYLDVGLEKIAGSDPGDTVTSVKRFPLENIFRVGYGAALELKWRAQQWIQTAWFIDRGLDTSFWGPNWADMLEGLLMKQPLYYTQFEEGGDPYREFRTLEEISRYSRNLDELIAMDRLFSRLLTDRSLESFTEVHHGVTYKNLLLTLWAAHHLTPDESPTPLTEQELNLFFQQLWSSSHPPFRIPSETRDAFLNWMAEHGGTENGETGANLGDRLHGLLDELEAEYGNVSLNDLDPRYVRHFLVFR